MNSPANARMWDGLTADAGVAERLATMVLRLVEPAVTETVKMASIIAGSMMAAMDISRLEPSPPKACPGVQSGQRQKKPPKREEIHHGDDVSGPMQGYGGE